jgi:S1-C subfamily serine protease
MNNNTNGIPENEIIVNLDRKALNGFIDKLDELYNDTLIEKIELRITSESITIIPKALETRINL